LLKHHFENGGFHGCQGTWIAVKFHFDIGHKLLDGWIAEHCNIFFNWNFLQGYDRLYVCDDSLFNQTLNVSVVGKKMLLLCGSIGCQIFLA
jgi:hypothetical protein